MNRLSIETYNNTICWNGNACANANSGADTIFSAALGGAAAYRVYKGTDYFVGKNGGTNAKDTNAKIRANEEPVK